MGVRAEKILMNYLEDVSNELAALNQKKKTVRRNQIILDDRLMQNSIVLWMDREGDFFDIYCKRGETGIFYLGFRKSAVSREYYTNFIRIFNIFKTWNYKTNYVDLYGLFNKLTILSFVEHWEYSMFNDPDKHIVPLKLGDYHLKFICHDSSSVDLEIDGEKNVVFTRIYEYEKNISSLSFIIKDKKEQKLILCPGTEEHQIMIDVITKILDERRFFEKENYDEFYEYSWENTFQLLDFPDINNFQETSQKSPTKVHFFVK
jgi:hypothetical protein